MALPLWSRPPQRSPNIPGSSPKRLCTAWGGFKIPHQPHPSKTRSLKVGEDGGRMGCVDLRAVASAGPVTSLRASASSLSQGGHRLACRQPQGFRQAAWPEPTLAKHPFPSCPGDTHLVVWWERLAAWGFLRLRAADQAQHASLQHPGAQTCPAVLIEDVSISTRALWS